MRDFLKDKTNQISGILHSNSYIKRVVSYLIVHNVIRPKRIGLFVSIPKNASHSVRLILDIGRNRSIENTFSPIIFENHVPSAILSRKYNFDKLFTFCFARNPYSRCISWYNFHLKRGFELYASLSFEEWILQGMPHHWLYKHDYIRDGTPLLQYSFIENCKIDYIGNIETFSRDLKAIIDRLNALCIDQHLKRRFKYSEIKAGEFCPTSPNFEQYYNKKTKDMVYSLLQKYFEYFGYDK